MSEEPSPKKMRLNINIICPKCGTKNPLGKTIVCLNEQCEDHKNGVPILNYGITDLNKKGK